MPLDWIDVNEVSFNALLLVEQGFQWAVFIEPPADKKRKYWKDREV